MGVGTAALNAAAALDIRATDRGLLVVVNPAATAALLRRVQAQESQGEQDLRASQ